MKIDQNAKLEALKSEVKENAGKGDMSWDWLDLNLGKCEAILAKTAISAAIVIILILFGMLHHTHRKKHCLTEMNNQTSYMMGLNRTHLVNVLANEQTSYMLPMIQGVLNSPDLFPVPDYMRDDDTEEEEGV